MSALTGGRNEIKFVSMLKLFYVYLFKSNPLLITISILDTEGRRLDGEIGTGGTTNPGKAE